MGAFEFRPLPHSCFSYYTSRGNGQSSKENSKNWRYLSDYIKVNLQMNHPIEILLKAMMAATYWSPSPYVIFKCSMLSLQGRVLWALKLLQFKGPFLGRKKIGHKIKHRALEGPVQAKDPKFILHELHENTTRCPRWLSFPISTFIRNEIEA